MTNHDDVANDIERMLEEAEQCVTDDCCIFKVPFDIRKLNEDAYTPKCVSIGPLHHNLHPHLQNMEKYKITYCKDFLERTKTSSDKWISYIKKVEPKFRRCYSDTLKEQLVQIIFVDSGFIFEYFLKYLDYFLGQPRPAQPSELLLKPKVQSLILLDLLLLENQLPFFVLEDLFNLSHSDSDSSRHNSFRWLTVHFFSMFHKSNLDLSCYYNISIRHFTDLARSFHLQCPQQSGDRNIIAEKIYFPSATELSEAGVKFKANKETKCLLDLKFLEGNFEIPPLSVDGIQTQVLFRNMVALEQFLYPSQSYIIDYVKVLNLLVNTSKDAEILIGHEILTNWLEDTDSVAEWINGQGQNVVMNSFRSDYFQICTDLNDFYKDPWNKWKATLNYKTFILY